jgi:hypothetical protein
VRKIIMFQSACKNEEEEEEEKEEKEEEKIL